MDEVIMKGIGLWLLAVIESLVVFIAFCIGHAVNGMPAELAVCLGSMLGSSQILVFLIIRKLFKITE